jgi:hypothetical protein
MSASREKRLRRELREAELNSDTVKKKTKKKKPKNPAKAKKLRSAIYSAIAIVLVVVFAMLIFVNCGFLQTHATALTVGSHKLTPAEFNYYYQDAYASIYSNYYSSGLWSYLVDESEPIEDQSCMFSEDGGTWKDYLTQSASDTALQVYALYDAAQEAGFTLDEDTQASIDTMADNIESYATSNGYKDGDAYMEETYGKGCTVESYVDYLTVQQVASAYATEKSDSFTYTEDELRSYYDENNLDFDKVTYRVFSVTTEDDDSDAAKSTADSMAAELDGTEETFAAAALEYAPEDDQESYEDDTYTQRKNYSYSSVSSYDYGDWLFADGRVAGESQVFASDTGYDVVMFVSRDNNDYNVVSVRHILASVETSGDDSTSTDEDWENCKAAIDEIEAQWEESDQTEDTFASMAEELSDDTSSATNGGLLEDIYKGQMVEEFEDWCFADGRQVGDTGIVKTTYGYHLIYFSSIGDQYWQTLADDAKRSEDYSNWYTEFSANYEAKSSTVGQWFTNKAIAS